MKFKLQQRFFTMWEMASHPVFGSQLSDLAQALARCAGNSLHLPYHLHKRRLGWAMKNPSYGKAAWIDIAGAKF